MNFPHIFFLRSLLFFWNPHDGTRERAFHRGKILHIVFQTDLLRKLASGVGERLPDVHSWRLLSTDIGPFRLYFVSVCLLFWELLGEKVARKIWCCRVGAATWKRRARLFSRIIFHFHSVLLVAVCNYSRASNAGLLHNLGISGELAETIRRARFALE